MEWREFRGFYPTPGNVVVELEPVEEKTAGGLYVPETVVQPAMYGKVLAVGPAARSVYSDTMLYPPIALMPGVRVAVGRYAGNEITYEGHKLIVMKFADILAIVDAPTPQPAPIPLEVSGAHL